MKKCAIVTGGASGIGLSIAQALSREGHSIVIADTNEEKGLLESEKIAAFFVKADLVLFLCSDKGASVTGACWTIDCGRTAR